MNAIERKIELLFFDGCPNADRARDNLRAALGASSSEAPWTEVDLESGELPERLRGYGSPTVLVDGRDVTGARPSETETGDAISCRADGAPSSEDILQALREG